MEITEILRDEALCILRWSGTHGGVLSGTHQKDDFCINRQTLSVSSLSLSSNSYAMVMLPWRSPHRLGFVKDQRTFGLQTSQLTKLLSLRNQFASCGQPKPTCLGRLNSTLQSPGDDGASYQASQALHLFSVPCSVTRNVHMWAMETHFTFGEEAVRPRR